MTGTFSSLRTPVTGGFALANPPPAAQSPSSPATTPLLRCGLSMYAETLHDDRALVLLLFIKTSSPQSGDFDNWRSVLGSRMQIGLFNQCLRANCWSTAATTDCPMQAAACTMTGQPSPRWRVVATSANALSTMTSLQLQSTWAGSNVCVQPRVVDGLAIAAPCQTTSTMQRFRVHCEPTYCNSIGNLCLECQSAGVCARCVDGYFVNVFGMCGALLR